MLDKLNAHLGEDMDLVAMDVQYHAPCVNAYMRKRQKAESVYIHSKHKNNAFVSLTEQLYIQLIVNKSLLCLSSICDTYRTMLQKENSEGAEGYRTSLLKNVCWTTLAMLYHSGHSNMDEKAENMFVLPLYQLAMPSVR